MSFLKLLPAEMVKIISLCTANLTCSELYSFQLNVFTISTALYLSGQWVKLLERRTLSSN